MLTVFRRVDFASFPDTSHCYCKDALCMPDPYLLSEHSSSLLRLSFSLNCWRRPNIATQKNIATMLARIASRVVSSKYKKYIQLIVLQRRSPLDQILHDLPDTGPKFNA